MAARFHFSSLSSLSSALPFLAALLVSCLPMVGPKTPIASSHSKESVESLAEYAANTIGAPHSQKADALESQISEDKAALVTEPVGG